MTTEARKRFIYPAILIVSEEHGDYREGELYFGPTGRLMLVPKNRKEGEEDWCIGEWDQGRLKLTKGLFRQTGRNMEIIDQIMTERVVIKHGSAAGGHRDNIAKLKEQLQDRITEDFVKQAMERPQSPSTSSKGRRRWRGKKR